MADTLIGHNGGPPDRQPGDWVAIQRSIRKHPLVGFGQAVAPCDPTRGAYSLAEAWLDLIMECRYEAGVVNNNGRRMELAPGQLLGATSWLASRWNWTPKTVRGFLDKLAREGMIELATPVLVDGRLEVKGKLSGTLSGTLSGKLAGRFAAIVTVCKYSLYQVLPEQQGQVTGHVEWQVEGHVEGQQYKDNNSNKGNKRTPPFPPKGGEPEGASPEPEAVFAGEPAKRTRPAEQRGLVDEAVRVFNLAAKHWGFASCKTVTDARAKLIARRVTEIGGVDRWKDALRAVGRDDFLAGKVAPRPGQEPFRLDIDKLLSTRSGLGDVLARLIDLWDAGNDPEQMIGKNGKRWGWWAGKEDRLRGLSVVSWRSLVDAHRPNGVWPWWELGPPPGHPDCFVPAEITAERGYVEKYRGNINAKEAHA